MSHCEMSEISNALATIWNIFEERFVNSHFVAASCCQALESAGAIHFLPTSDTLPHLGDVLRRIVDNNPLDKAMVFVSILKNNIVSY